MFTSEQHIVRVLGADDWERCDNLSDLSTYFGNPTREPMASERRKFRLLVVAAIRAVWSHVPPGVLRDAVETAERFADDADEGALRTAHSAADRVFRSIPVWPHPAHPGPEVSTLAQAIVNCTADTVTTPHSPRWRNILAGLSSGFPDRTQEQAHALHLQLFRDIIPNPFRRIWFDPDWRTDTAVPLARHVYESRDFSLMPVLADALQDAGCDNDDVLNHCRGPGPHTRGCWVVDLVLGKA